MTVSVIPFAAIFMLAGVCSLSFRHPRNEK